MLMESLVIQGKSKVIYIVNTTLQISVLTSCLATLLSINRKIQLIMLTEGDLAFFCICTFNLLFQLTISLSNA